MLGFVLDFGVIVAVADEDWAMDAVESGFPLYFLAGGDWVQEQFLYERLFLLIQVKNNHLITQRHQHR